MAQPKAYGLLAEQPLSATDVVLEQRCNIVLGKNTFCRNTCSGHRQIGASVDDQFRAIDAA